MGLLRDTLRLVTTLAGDAIDEWAENESRSALQRRLRENAERGAELALENAALKDEIDRLRFNGPTLYRDEVEFLRDCQQQLQQSILDAELFGADLKMLGRNLQIVQHLLERCDHMPMTEGEMTTMVEDITSGKAKLIPWDDEGKDIDVD